MLKLNVHMVLHDLFTYFSGDASVPRSAEMEMLLFRLFFIEKMYFDWKNG